jgi:hypothetical protein
MKCVRGLSSWINATLDNLPSNSPARIVITNARNNGQLFTAVAGVNKATGSLVIVPVKVK